MVLESQLSLSMGRGGGGRGGLWNLYPGRNWQGTVCAYAQEGQNAKASLMPDLTPSFPVRLRSGLPGTVGSIFFVVVVAPPHPSPLWTSCFNCEVTLPPRGSSAVKSCGYKSDPMHPGVGWGKAKKRNPNFEKTS